MLHFTALWAFLLLPLPWLAMYVLPKAKPAEQAALRVPFLHKMRPLASSNHRFSNWRWWQRVLAYSIWVLLVVAASGPQWLGPPTPITQAGRNIMLAIDISGSMEITDMRLGNQQVNRLRMIKSVAGQFVNERVGDRVGLILFGTRAYLQTPLTFDRQTVQSQLNDASIGLAGQMTAIGDAIGLAIKRLMQYPAKSRVLVLLTDGASNSGSVLPIDAATMAAKQGIQIYTIGIGSSRAVAQTFWGPQAVNLSADLDEDTLKKIANATQGQYFRATDGQSLQHIYQRINQLQPINSDKQFFRPVDNLYDWPLGLALLLSLLLAIITLRRVVGNL